MYRVTKKFTAQDAFSDSIQYIIIAGTKLNYRVNTATNILQISILDDNETEIAVRNNFNIDQYLKYEDDGVKKCDEEVTALEVRERAKECVDNFKPTLNNLLAEVEDRIESAFLYGYACGETDEKFRTKQVIAPYTWHNLKENPNDLPDSSRFVWCDYGEDYGKGYYNKDDGAWWIEGHIYCSIIDAWCELPKRNKEKANG